MKFVQKLTNERFAKSAARFMKLICYLVMCFYALCTILSFMGRQTFFLHTKSGTFERAIYAEENHNSHSRSMTVYMGDDIRVWTNSDDQIGWTIAYVCCHHDSNDLCVLVSEPCIFKHTERRNLHRTKCSLSALLWAASVFGRRACALSQIDDLRVYQPCI